MTRVNRREFLALGGRAAAGACLMGLAGCGGTGDGGGAQAEGTPASGYATGGDGRGLAGQLRATWWGADERHRRTTAALEYFQQQHAGVTITPEYSGWDEYWDRLSTQVAAGNAPDLLQQNYTRMAEYADRGTLLDLGAFEGEVLDLRDLDEVVVSQGVVDGTRVAIPLGSNTEALYYDTARLQQAGVEPPEASWTWEDLADLALRITQGTEEGYYGTEDAGMDSTAFALYLRQCDKEFFTPDGALGFAGDDLIEWFDYWAQLRASSAALPADLQAGIVEPVVFPRAAMQFAYSNQLTAFQDLTPDELGVVVYPNGPPGSSPGQFIISTGLMMSGFSQTAHPEVVAAVIDTFLNDPEAIRILGTERGVPPSAKARELLRPELEETEQKALDYFETSRACCRWRPPRTTSTPTRPRGWVRSS